MAGDDGRRTCALPSLHKTAYHACNQVQRDMYNGWRLPPVDLQSCCTRLFEVLKVNADRGEFDPLRDRRGALHKVWPVHVVFDILEVAATHGHYDCLRFAHEITDPWLVRIDNLTCTNAAKVGNLNCLRYAHEIGCRWDSKTCAGAAENGHLHCLRYAHENGCSWDSKTCSAAVKNGHIQCLIYAMDNGCPWGDIPFEGLIHLHSLEYVMESMLSRVAADRNAP